MRLCRTVETDGIPVFDQCCLAFRVRLHDRVLKVAYYKHVGLISGGHLTLAVCCFHGCVCVLNKGWSLSAKQLVFWLFVYCGKTCSL